MAACTRNLMQNAKQFALHEVNIHISWTEENINVSIVDDGAGFSPSVLAHAGQPWNSSRTGQGGHRGLVYSSRVRCWNQ